MAYRQQLELVGSVDKSNYTQFTRVPWGSGGELDKSAHEGGEDGGHLVDDGTAGPHADTHQVSRHSLYHAN